MRPSLMTMRISVAMATYNGEKYIKQQLDSLAEQTVLPKELVVCDDRSIDSTVSIVEEFATGAPFPVKIILNEKNLGYADNFLKCAGLCEGDWIAFCDQDDFWMPNKIERVTKKINDCRDTNLVLVGHTSIVGDESLNTTNQRVPYFKRDKYIKRRHNQAFFCIVGFSAIVKSNLILDFDHRLRIRLSEDGSTFGHDQWIGMLANAVGSIGYISEPLAIWRRHDLSTTGTPNVANLFVQVKVASRSFFPEEYYAKGRMAENASKSLEDIARVNTSSLFKEGLLDASKSFYKLAHNLKLRGQLYETSGGLPALRVLLKLISNIAYFDLPIQSLGWRSFLKDIAFTFGVIKNR